jgi:uncharacterized protein
VLSQPVPSQSTAIDRRQPTIWAISAWRAGDHAQLVALADALEEAFGWQTEFKPVFDRRHDPAGFGYQGPWPDVVVGIGRGGTRLGLWIKQQSGGKTKFIQLGRLEGPMDDCDLIVTTAQYGFPDNANLIRLTLPLTPRGKADEASLAQWRASFASLPRPLNGVLVGGPSVPLLMGAAEATRLARDIEALAEKTGGSLLIATGRRTPAEMVEVLSGVVGRTPDRRRLIVFPAEGFARPEDNPYRAILALADSFIVTADSVSMLADACATGKPVTLFNLPATPGSLSFKGFWRWRRRRRFVLGKRPDLIDRIYDAGIRRGSIHPGRNVPSLIAWLLRGGGVSGDAAKSAEMAARLAIERQMVLTRIQALLAPGQGQLGAPA